MKKILLATTLAVSLGGCSTIGPAFQVLTGGSVATQAPATVATAEKALTVAHLALNTIGEDIIAATHSGVLHGPTAVSVKEYYDKADDGLKAADQLDKAANAQGVVDKVNAVDTLIAQIHSLVPSH